MSASPMVQAQDSAKAARFYEDALRRYEKRDLPGAIIQLKNALQADKNQLSVHLLLGKALLANSEPAAAELAFNEALRLGVSRAEIAVPLAMAMSAQGRQPLMLDDPRLSPVGLPPSVQQPLLLERALAQSDLGNIKAAMSTVLAARAIDASTPDTWIAEVPLRVRTRQFSEALAAADQALKLSPGNAEALYQRGATLHAMGRVGEALAHYDRVVLSSPRHAETRLARAGLYVDLNRNADAATEVAELLKIKPRDPRGTYIQALLAERGGDAAESKKLLKSLTSLLDPVPIEYIRFRPQLLMLNGLAHYGLGELENAKPYLELAAKQQSNSPLSKLLAQIALAEPNLSRALDLLEPYVKAMPGDGQALMMLASAYMQQGRHERATTLMQDALKAKDAPEFRTVLGMAMLQSGKNGQAANELSKAYKQDSTNLTTGLSLAAAQLREGQTSKALALAEALGRSHPENASVVMLLAYAKAQAKDASGARSDYERALKLSPTLLDAQIGLARLDAVARNFDAANRRLRGALKSNEREPSVLFELALLHEQWGKDDEALKWLESAAEASSQREARANFALVAWHLRKGSPARAVESAKALLAKMPEDVEALQAYAAAQAANGDAGGAKSTLTNASRRAAFEAPRLVDVARQQLLIRDFSGAAYSLEKALSAAPGDISALALLASVELSRGDAVRSEQYARQVIGAAPNSATGYYLLSEAAASRSQPSIALEALRKAHDLEKSGKSLVRLMHVLATQGQTKVATALANTWISKRPQDLGVRNALAEILVRQRDFTGARKQYNAILSGSPDDLTALNNLANTLIELKDPNAVQVAEQGLRLAPRSVVLLDTTGWAHHHLGDGDRAIQLLRDARLRAPGNRDIRYHLAAALAKAGRSVEARAELNTALQDGVNFASLDDARKLLSTLN